MSSDKTPEFYFNGAGSHSQLLPMWETLQQEAAAQPTSNKRSYDSIEDLVSDAKKRKIVPTYDARACVFSVSGPVSSHMLIRSSSRNG